MGIVAESRALVRWPQEQQVPPRGWYHVYRDNRDGAVDYGTPITPAPIDAWPDGQGKVGDGLGPDGSGADGFGWGGAGDGYGMDGCGLDGFGAAAIKFTTPWLRDGTWTFAVIGFDWAGNPSAPGPAAVTAAAALAGTPEPPGVPTADAYDSGTDTLTLSWALSPDDEG